MSAFPKVIYQVWFQGQDDLSFRSRPHLLANMNGWKCIQSPEWSHRLLDQRDLEEACRSVSARAVRVFHKFASWDRILAIDFGRYCYLYTHGGIYVDMDMWCLRPLELSESVRAFLSRVTHPMPMPLLAISKMLVGHPYEFNTGMMMSTVLHPFLKQFIDTIMSICETTAERPSANLMPYYIQRTTGPWRLTQEVYRFCATDPHRHDMIFPLPYPVFEPCAFVGTGEKVCRISADTVAMHEYQLSWIPNSYTRTFTGWYNSWYTLIDTFPLSLVGIMVVTILLTMLMMRRGSYGRKKKKSG